MGDPAPFLAAARRYGSKASFDQMARQKYGISGPALLAKLAKGESGFDMTAISKAGARGGTQFMPATRDEYLKRYGVDAYASPDSAVHATELYLAHDGRGLAGYNPGDPTYTRYILGQKVGAVGKGASPAGGTPRTPAGSTGGTSNAGARGALIASFLQGGDSRFTDGTGAQGLATSDPVKFALALRGLKDTPGTKTAAPSSSVAPSGPSRPTADGKIIGVPYQGTHTLGNWQSDNAVDIAVPIGSPMRALQDGTVVKVTKHPQGAGRFAGDQITVRGANGNEYFYAHGVAAVKPGETIRKGQSLGTTGSANGVAHLHFGQMKGDPREHVKT